MGKTKFKKYYKEMRKQRQKHSHRGYKLKKISRHSNPNLQADISVQRSLVILEKLV